MRARAPRRVRVDRPMFDQCRSAQGTRDRQIPASRIARVHAFGYFQKIAVEFLIELPAIPLFRRAGSSHAEVHALEAH